MQEAELQRLVQADWDSYYYQKQYGVHVPLIDLSAVVFSANDLARIEIPPFSRIEDQILGYCIKYWNTMDDPAFERILFLYSRKYGRKNYDVYMSIRRGRQAKHRDDEILASIMSVLITGYYYSIQGDLYLQRNWNAIKHALANQNQVKAPPAPEAKQIEDKSSHKRAVIKRRTEKKSSREKVPVSKIAPKPQSKTAPKIAPKSFKLKSRPVAVVAKPKSFGTQPAFKSNTVGALGPAPKPVKVPYKLKPAPEIKTTIVAPAKPQPKPAPQPIPSAVPKPVVRPAAPKPAVPARPVAAPPKPAVLLRPVAAPPRPTVPTRPVAAPPPRPAVPVRPAAAPIPARPVQPATPFRPVAAAPKPAASPVKPLASAPPVQSGYRPAPFVTASAPPRPKPKQKIFTNKTLEKAKGSVSDRLKKLSGRSYDVYEDRFLAKARNAIRKVLGTGRGLFFNLPEEAEDLVYNFLRDHYADPYLDWEDSADR
jgi:hypothetical protein